MTDLLEYTKSRSDSPAEVDEEAHLEGQRGR